LPHLSCFLRPAAASTSTAYAGPEGGAPASPAPWRASRRRLAARRGTASASAPSPAARPCSGGAALWTPVPCSVLSEDIAVTAARKFSMASLPGPIWQGTWSLIMTSTGWKLSGLLLGSKRCSFRAPADSAGKSTASSSRGYCARAARAAASQAVPCEATGMLAA